MNLMTIKICFTIISYYDCYYFCSVKINVKNHEFIVPKKLIPSDDPNIEIFLLRL